MADKAAKTPIIDADLQVGFTDPACPLCGDLDRVVASCKELTTAYEPEAT